MRRKARPLERVALIAGQAVRETTRQRVATVPVALALVCGAAALWLREFNFGATEMKFLLDVSFGSQAFFGAVLAIVGSAQLFHAELDRKTVLFVLARPVRREEFMAGKLVGVLVLLLGFCGLMTGLVLALLWWRGTGAVDGHTAIIAAGRRVPYAGIVWCGLLQWLRLGVVAAMTLLVASWARSAWHTIMTAFFVLVICEMQSVVREFYGLTESAWTRGAAALLGIVLPDLGRFDLTDRVVDGGGLPANEIGGLVTYALIYLGLFGALAAVSFRHREL